MFKSSDGRNGLLSQVIQHCAVSDHAEGCKGKVWVAGVGPLARERRRDSFQGFTEVGVRAEAEVHQWRARGFLREGTQLYTPAVSGPPVDWPGVPLRRMGLPKRTLFSRNPVIVVVKVGRIDQFFNDWEGKAIEETGWVVTGEAIDEGCLGPPGNRRQAKIRDSLESCRTKAGGSPYIA